LYLLSEIEKLRSELYKFSVEKDLVNPKVIELSQQLDCLLNQYALIAKNKTMHRNQGKSIPRF
jgi:hypothetical protein